MVKVGAGGPVLSSALVLVPAILAAMWRSQFLVLGVGLLLAGALVGACRGDADPADPWAGVDSSARTAPSEDGSTGSAEDGDLPSAEPSPVDSVSAEAEKVSARQVLAAVQSYIKQQTREGEGSFRLFDQLTSSDVALRLVKVQKKVYKLEGRGPFVRAVFVLAEVEGKRRYELDFWVNYASDGDPDADDEELLVTDTRIRSHPVQAGSAWKSEARYTFAPADLAELK